MTGVMSATSLKPTLVDLLTKAQTKAGQAKESVLVSLCQPVIVDFSPLAFFSAVSTASWRTFWGQPDKDFWLVGNGGAVFAFDGTTSMNSAAKSYRSLMNGALIETPDVPGVGPIAMSGFRYDTESARDADWHDYPDAMLGLPRFLLTRSGESSWLTINAMVAPEADIALQADDLVAELEAIDIVSFKGNPQPVVNRVEQSSPEEYARYVQRALQDINAGLLTKVVLARRKILYADEPFSADTALGELCQSYQACTIFAIDNGVSTFLGATPESLVQVNQGRLSLSCLAGSNARGNTPEEDLELEKQLSESVKEQTEHAAVVAAVTASLKDFCSELNWYIKPEILKLKNVQHLLTSVNGSLYPGNSILDVVKQLHPTPAVAGIPTDRAMSFIRNGESDRGWYAAPLGWTDHTGSGEFATGIRSALIAGNRAILYAGAGIVKGSDPEKEFMETELKFQPLMSALGGKQ